MGRLDIFKPFIRSREEVTWFLETVLYGHMDCRQWDSFVRIPIKGDPEMDAVRQACVQLEADEIIEDDGRLYHKSEAKAKLEKMLSHLKTNTEQADAPNP
jgi:hypothetical protein